MQGNMMQRFLTPALFGILTTINAGAIDRISSSVQTTGNPVAQFTGFSLGLHTGFIHVSANTNWVNHIPGIANNRRGRYATTAKGGSAGIHAILGRVYPNQFYLGGEVTAAVNYAKGTTKDDINFALIFRYSLRDSYTAALRAGLLANKILIYVKAGIALTGRKVEAQFLNSQFFSGTNGSRKYRFAPTVGFGFDVAVHKHVSCGLESSYTQYLSDRFIYPGAASYDMRTGAYDFKLKVTFKL